MKMLSGPHPNHTFKRQINIFSKHSHDVLTNVIKTSVKHLSVCWIAVFLFYFHFILFIYLFIFLLLFFRLPTQQKLST